MMDLISFEIGFVVGAACAIVSLIYLGSRG